MTKVVVGRWSRGEGCWSTIAGRTLAAVLIVVGAVAGLAALSAREKGGALPYYTDATFTPSWKESAQRVAPFTMLDQTGASLTDRDLAGRPYVASFIYTRCSVLCPQLVSGLKSVQERLVHNELTIVSFTVTPELDPPAVLAGFGRERGIDPKRWKLLTGSKADILALAANSFFADDERLRASLSGPEAFLHTEKLVLVDGVGRLRGVYNGSQRSDLDHLVEDARQWH